MIKPWAIILPSSPSPRLGRRTTPSAAAIKKLRLETPTDSPTAIKTLRTVGRRKPRPPQVLRPVVPRRAMTVTTATEGSHPQTLGAFENAP